ncbi:MAG: hypothetical protein VB130_05125 [Clostridium sp.]|nr:hypothetical protein [Clostridium sp.]
MGKLIKYELKGNYKLFGGLFGIVILLNILIFTRINKWSEPAIIALFSVVSVALFVTALVFVVNSFRNELYEDRGYLTFTLPVGGKKILASKLITGVIWFAIAGILTLISGKILLGKLFDINVMQQFNAYINTKAMILIAILFSIVNLIMLLLLIYFSITLTRVALKRKRMSKLLGFVAFILLNMGIYYIEYKLMQLFPQTIGFKLDFLQNVQSKAGSLSIGGQSMMSINDSSLNINIASTIYNIIIYIGLFLSTGYLMDNKIDI